MHIISRKKILEFTGRHPDAATPLDTWYRIAKRALWTSLNGVRSVYPHADPVGSCVVFNVGGNKFRLVVHIAYASAATHDRPAFGGKVFLLHILTHGDYDDGKWKADCGC
jgi:mRNA interferase HigB